MTEQRLGRRVQRERCALRAGGTLRDARFGVLAAAPLAYCSW
ncbi:hypothetical protein [Streptomyces sp. NPDC058463]